MSVRTIIKSAICGLAIILPVKAANAAAIVLNQQLHITASGPNGPINFDFGIVDEGLSNTYSGTLLISFFNPGGGPVTLSPLANGSLGSCPSQLISGSSCTTSSALFFSQTDSTPAGIYTGQQTLNYSFVNAAGAFILNPVTFSYSVNVGGVAPVPGPTVGAGLPGLVVAFGGFMLWYRRRQSAA